MFHYPEVPVPILILVSLSACGGDAVPESDTDTAEDTAEDTAAETGGGAVPFDGTDGVCDIGTSDAGDQGAVVVYDGTADGALSWLPTRVVETEAEWAAILAASSVDGAPQAVDFATHRVLVGAEWESSTCGLSRTSARVLRNNYGGPHLEVTIFDSSGGCETVCDMVQGYAYAVAVPREAGDPASVCRVLTGECT